MLVVGWIILCVAVAMFAEIRRNRNGTGWFFIALFLSPFIGFLLLAILQPLPKGSLASPKGDPRWRNLRAGVADDQAVARRNADIRAYVERSARSSRRAMIGAMIVLACTAAAGVVIALTTQL